MATVNKGYIGYSWVILASSVIIMGLTSAGRSAFGVFVKPWYQEFGWGVSAISLGASFQALTWGFSDILWGRVADRYGPRLVMCGGLFLFGAALLLTARMESLWQFYVFYGMLGGVGFSASSMLVNQVLIARWFEKGKGLALAISSTGSMIGIAVLVPVATWMLLSWGWRVSYSALAWMLLGLGLPLAAGLVRSSPSARSGARHMARHEKELTVAARTSLRQAMRTRPFWLLLGSYFVCGYSVILISTHLIPFAMENGVSAIAAAQVFSLMSLFSILGTLAFGAVSDRVGWRNPLAVCYLLRGSGVAVLLLANQWQPALFLGASLIGLAFLASASLITALLADFYGPFSVGALLGPICLAHQIGGALGAYLAGWILNAMGSYHWALLLTAIMLAGAGIATFTIPDKAAMSVKRKEQFSILAR